MSTQLHHREIFREGIPYFTADTTFPDRGISRTHSHDFYEIFLITRGRIQHRVNGHESLVGQGMLCFLHPEDSHDFRQLGEEQALMQNLAFTGSLFNESMEFLFGPSWRKQVGIPGEIRNADPGLLMLMDELLQMAALGCEPAEQTLHTATVKVLLATLLRKIARPLEAERAPVPEWLSSAVSRMEKPGNFEEGLDAFIRLAGRSKEHLCRSMQRYYGMSPTTFINRLRLRKSAYLLRSTNRTVTEIIFDSGFNNVSYFNRIFKQYFGCSPKEFRKQAGEVLQ